jgi:hypothetical protein
MNRFTKISVKTLFLLVLVIICFSCHTQKPIEKAAPQNNPTYEIEYLFEHEGCKIYRFRDNGHYVYFTNCKGDITSVENDSTATRIVNRINK